jgi:hypothetical protein
MREVSNNIIVILITVFMVVFLLEVSLYIRFISTPTAKAAVGFVGFCVDKDFSLIPIGDQTAYVNHTYYYDVNVTNENESHATFQDDTNLFDINSSTGEIEFTPDDSQLGQEYLVNISVLSPCRKLKCSEIVKFTITYWNRPPVLDFIPNQTIYQNDHFVYDVNATDPDNDVLTFEDNATFFEINPSTGIIDFIPVQDDVGNHSVMIWVRDPRDAWDSQITNFEIIDVNDPPVLRIGAQTAIINTTYEYTVSAIDVDTVLPHTLRFYDNATFFDINETTGEIEFFVNESYEGTYDVNISVTDGELWDSKVISFTVTLANRPPVITAWSPLNENITIKEGQYQTFIITKYDPDGTIPSVQWYLNRQELAGETNDNYTYYASYVSSGNYNVTVVVSDGELTDSHGWNLTVEDVYIPPYQPPPPPPPSAPIKLTRCIENWRCSSWSVCPEDEIQIRECWDLNACGTTFNKPNESRSCIYVRVPSCFDGVRNCHHGGCEILTDCGGPCPPCPSCSDGIQNQNESGIDCGGPCPPCQIPIRKVVCGDGICEPGELYCIQDCGFILAGTLMQFLILIFSLTAVLILVFKAGSMTVASYMRRRKPYSMKELIGLYTLRRLHLLQLQVTEKDVRKLSKDLSSIMQEFFAKIFNIKYEFTYIEINEIARKKGVSKDLTKLIMNFSIKISEMQYSKHKTSISEVLSSIKLAIRIVEELTGVKMYESLEEKAEKELAKVEPFKEKIMVEKRGRAKEILTKEYMNKIRELILEGEKAIERNDIKKAKALYSDIRTLYDKIGVEQRKELYEETIRILKLYSNIMKALK